MENSIKSLLVHLDGTARAETRLRLAQQLAGTCHARVSALFAVAPRYLSVLPLGAGTPSMPSGAPVDPEHRFLALNMFEEGRIASTQPCEWLELSGEPVVETFSRIVMGCYGHSRARELVLGGATRTVLESMTVPVLMAH